MARSGKHIFCAPCRDSMALYNLARRQGLPRPKVSICKVCRKIKYQRYGEKHYQRSYKRRIRAA